MNLHDDKSPTKIIEKIVKLLNVSPEDFTDGEVIDMIVHELKKNGIEVYD